MCVCWGFEACKFCLALYNQSTKQLIRIEIKKRDAYFLSYRLGCGQIYSYPCYHIPAPVLLSNHRSLHRDRFSELIGAQFKENIEEVLFVQANRITKTGIIYCKNWKPYAWRLSAENDRAHPSVCEEQHAPGMGWNTCTASHRTHKHSSQFLQTRKHTIRSLLSLVKPVCTN